MFSYLIFNHVSADLSVWIYHRYYNSKHCVYFSIIYINKSLIKFKIAKTSKEDYYPMPHSFGKLAESVVTANGSGMPFFIIAIKFNITYIIQSYQIQYTKYIPIFAFHHTFCQTSLAYKYTLQIKLLHH